MSYPCPGVQTRSAVNSKLSPIGWHCGGVSQSQQPARRTFADGRCQDQVPHGLKDCHSLILGTTGETLEHVECTLDFVAEFDPFAAVMLVWVDDLEVLDARTELERRCFCDAIHEPVRERAADQPRWVVPRLGLRFNPTSLTVLRKHGMRGPTVEASAASAG